MAEYDNTNTGLLFPEDEEKKKDENDRDFNGSLNVNGVEYWVSGYKRKSKKTGKPFLKLTVKAKNAHPSAPQHESPAAGMDDAFDL